MNLKINLPTEPKDVREWLFFGKAFLKERKIESYSLDSEILLMFVLNFSKVQLFTKDNYVLSEEEKERYLKLLEKRGAHMPVKYIIGKCEFMGLEFIVDSSTLIPRGDTEILVERVIDFIKENNFRSVLDIGTGSGAVAISAAFYCPNVKITTVDISKEALKTAEKNAEINNVLDRINFVESDVFKNIVSKFDIIVSNPPYIKTDVIKSLMPDVRDYEPVSALDGGSDGLYFYRKIISECKDFLNKNGVLIFEIGYDQTFEVLELLRKSGFDSIEIKQDLAGLDRVISCVYRD